MVQVTFSVEQSKDTTEWFTLTQGREETGRLEFDGDKSFTLDLKPGVDYDIAGYLIGKNKDKVAISVTIGDVKEKVLEFSLQQGMLGTRETSGGNLLGGGTGYFSTPED